MLDIDKDVKVKIRMHNVGKCKAMADVIIGDLIQVNGFEITQADNGKIYVINPHTIKNVYNKVEFKREVTYYATANLLPHEDRKKLVNKIIEAFAEEIDSLKKTTENAETREIKITNKTKHSVGIEEINKEWE